MTSRILKDQISLKLADQKALIILGPRQVGKTTLLHMLLDDLKEDTVWWDGDETDIRQTLAQPTSTKLKAMIGQKKYVVIDEAQRIENIGICIKLITDNIPDVKVIASGSSSFDLANQIKEPLTGRKWEFTLLPFSYEELVNHHGWMDEKRLLEHRLIYGCYPEIVNQPGNEQELLHELSQSYLYKDILTWENIQKPDKLEKLLQALAFQVGQIVSYHELAQTTGLNFQTVERYIELLEKTFIIYRLGTFSRNLRNELKKRKKIYFYDNGIRNALVKQFNSLELRNDKGALWENYIMSERQKFLYNHRIFANQYFWRTSGQQEIDYIEEREGSVHAYEFKAKAQAKANLPKSFANTYKNHQFQVIHPENIETFLLP